MTIEQLGELSADERIEDWLTSRPVPVAYFSGAQLPFVLDGLKRDPAPTEFAEAVRRFLSLTVSDREQATEYVYKNYRDFVEAVGEGDVEVHVDSPAEIWQHVVPTEIVVKRRFYGDQKIYVLVAAECGWEPEHGLQIVYREGSRLSRVSAQDGHLTYSDARALPEDQDRI